MVRGWCSQGHCVFDQIWRVFHQKYPAKGHEVLGFADAPGRLNHGDEGHHLLAVLTFDL